MIWFAFAGIKFAALFVGLFSRRSGGPVVLTLHRVLADARGEMAITPRMFDQVLKRLAGRYRLLEGNQFRSTVEAGDRRCALITVDDGFSDFYDTVFPALKSHGVPVVLFVPTEFVNQPDNVPVSYAHDPAAYRPCSWAQLREMQASGLVEIGAHSHRHFEAPTLFADELRADIEASHQVFQAEGIKQPRFFAYPRGAFDEASARIVSEYYEYAFAGTPQDGLPGALADYAVPRLPIRGSDQPFFWRLKVAGYLDQEEAVIRWLKAFLGRFRGKAEV